MGRIRRYFRMAQGAGAVSRQSLTGSAWIMRRVAFIAVWAVLNVAAVGVAGAQPVGAEPEVDRLSSLAIEMAKAGRLEDAIQIWRALTAKVDSESLPDVELNLAIAYRKLEQLPEAWHYLSAYVRVRPDEAPVLKELGAVEQRLKATHALVHFECKSTGVLLTFEDKAGAAKWPCPLDWWMAPGDYRVAASIGEVFVVLPVRVSAERKSLAVVVPTLASPEMVTEAGGAGSGQGDSGVTRGKGSEGVADGGLSTAYSGPNVVWPATLFVAGGLTLLAGGICGYVGYDLNQTLLKKYPDSGVTLEVFEANREKYGDAYDNDVAPLVFSSYVLYGAGAAAIIAGLTWLVLAEETPAVVPSVVLLPDGGMILGVTW